MSPISLELIVASAVGFLVLILSQLFPPLKDQFETMAPAVVAIVLFVLTYLMGNQLARVWSENSIRRAEIQSETTIKTAQLTAQSTRGLG